MHLRKLTDILKFHSEGSNSYTNPTDFIKAFKQTHHGEWINIQIYSPHWLPIVMKPKDVDCMEYWTSKHCLPGLWEELKTLFLTTFQSDEDVSALMTKMLNLCLTNNMSINAHTNQFESLHIQAQMSGHSEWPTDCYLA